VRYNSFEVLHTASFRPRKTRSWVLDLSTGIIASRPTGFDRFSHAALVKRRKVMRDANIPKR
jgi:hypothetical protein